MKALGWTLLALAAVALVGLLTLSRFGPVSTADGAESEQSADARTPIVVVVNEYAFVPDVIRVPVQPLVWIELRNEGGMVHNLTFRTIGQGTADVDPGESVDLKLSLPEPGEYPFECTKLGHAQKGLTGTLHYGVR